MAIERKLNGSPSINKDYYYCHYLLLCRISTYTNPVKRVLLHFIISYLS